MGHVRIELLVLCPSSLLFDAVVSLHQATTISLLASRVPEEIKVPAFRISELSTMQMLAYLPYACSAKAGLEDVCIGKAGTNRVFTTSRGETLLECYEAQHPVATLLMLQNLAVFMPSRRLSLLACMVVTVALVVR